MTLHLILGDNQAIGFRLTKPPFKHIELLFHYLLSSLFASRAAINSFARRLCACVYLGTSVKAVRPIYD